MRSLTSTGSGPGLVVVLGLALALAGCGPSGEGPAADGGVTAAAPEPTAVSATGLMAAARAPGARAVLVNVWATTCLPCVEELPAIRRLESRYREDGLRVVLVSADFGGTETRIVPLLTKLGVTFPTYLLEDSLEALVPEFHEAWTAAIPATLVLDGNGRVAGFHEGKASEERLEEMVRDVLGRQTAASKEVNREDR